MELKLTRRFAGLYYVKGYEFITIQSYAQYHGELTQSTEGHKWVLTIGEAGEDCLWPFDMKEIGFYDEPYREFCQTKAEAVERMKRVLFNK